MFNFDVFREKDSMFSKENLKIQNDWIRQEDFDDDANRKFLEQVYQLIKVNYI